MKTVRYILIHIQRCILLLIIFFVNAQAAVYPSSYDIVYHRINITVDPGTSSAISNGKVTTYFKTTVASVTQIGFDLNTSMTISSVNYHGTPLLSSKYPQASNAVIITLPAVIPAIGTLDSITINYSGTPVGPGSPVPSGYNFNSTNKAIYTLGESFTGSTWWPCHDSLSDKIDSVDLIVTTPSAYRAAGNGLVTETISGANRISTWKTRYRIATYMINFAAANYVDYTYNIITNGKTLPVHNYLYSADNTATYKTATDFIQSILPVYVSLFNSDYPFVNEKYGIADCYGSWGALEVQSMTFCATNSITSNSTLAHELAHQWFADKLTTDDWHQIWLNEGFAQYCESVIYPENLLSASTAASRRSSLKSSVTNSSTTYVGNISSAQTIFASSSSLYQPYEKGAMILSMLRSWIGTTKFFAALHNYLEAPGLAYNFTSVDSLQKYMQAQTPNDLNNFFSNWVNKKGTVTYSVKYQYVTNGVYIQLVQSPTSAGAGYFDMPVPLQIKNSSGLDTTVIIIDRGGKLYNSASGNTYGTNTIYYKLSATPNIAPVLDPNNNVLATASSTTSSSSLSTMITLPIEDINLTITADKQDAHINWIISSTDSLSSINIEKSANGFSFKSIAEYHVTNLPDGKYTGEFYDNNVDDGLTYYRIKVVKNNGQFVYSFIKLFRTNGANNLKISPNPVQNGFTVTIPIHFVENGKADILIYDNTGLLVSRKKVETTENHFFISAEKLIPGIYKIIVINETQHQLKEQFLKL